MANFEEIKKEVEVTGIEIQKGIKDKEISESAEEIKQLALMFSREAPSPLSYVEGTEGDVQEKNRNALHGDYETVVTNLINDLVETRSERNGGDEMSAIFDVARELVPPYDDSRYYWSGADKLLTIEDRLNAPGVACRHQALLTAQIANNFYKKRKGLEDFDVDVVMLRNFEVNGEPSPEGHFFIHLRDGDNHGYLDVTNPHLTQNPEGDGVIQGDFATATQQLFEIYIGRGINVPRMLLVNFDDHTEREVLQKDHVQQSKENETEKQE